MSRSGVRFPQAAPSLPRALSNHQGGPGLVHGLDGSRRGSKPGYRGAMAARTKPRNRARRRIERHGVNPFGLAEPLPPPRPNPKPPTSERAAVIVIAEWTRDTVGRSVRTAMCDPPNTRMRPPKRTPVRAPRRVTWRSSVATSIGRTRSTRPCAVWIPRSSPRPCRLRRSSPGSAYRLRERSTSRQEPCRIAGKALVWSRAERRRLRPGATFEPC
jgi:hypothetical protein